MRSKDICDKINRSKLAVAFNRKFDAKQLVKMLRNKRYIGIIEGDRVYKNIIPAIIKNEVFQKVSVRLDEAKRRSSHFGAKERYILSEKLYCGCCGAFMMSESGTGKSKRRYSYYKCANRKRHKICDAGAVSKEKIETLVIESIYHYINDENLNDRIDKYYADIKKVCAKCLYPKKNREKRQLLKNIGLFRKTDLHIFDQKYNMVNEFTNKVIYANGILQLHLNIMGVALEIVI